ncbi:MAG: antibiotic resistance protein MarC [Methanomicrobiales archaeon HGW-Methanomicrobiales-1]|jgi:multiple antibiotic resistance protein|nr:MAG: antibiotic resistance protein MarC [Methanomicrobiales archaeon HGW-Methanomicrobiales-1]
MAGDVLSFALLSISSILIIVNPLGATLIYVSLTTNLDQSGRDAVARDACRIAFLILLIVALIGTWVLQLFGITLEAFRIAGGILLFGIGMEMVYAKTSRTKLTATEKYESRDTEDIAIMPLAIPMIAGPGAITTTIVLMNEATTMTPIAIGIVLVSIAISIALTYYMMRNSDYILTRIGQREYRAINRLMGMLLIAIAVQFVINGIRLAFPLLSGG